MIRATCHDNRSFTQELLKASLMIGSGSEVKPSPELLCAVPDQLLSQQLPAAARGQAHDVQLAETKAYIKSKLTVRNESLFQKEAELGTLISLSSRGPNT